MEKKKVLILGKLPPPYFGPAIATRILLNSKLKNFYTLYHHDTSLNEEISGIGKINLGKIWRSFSTYISLTAKIIYHRPNVVLIPISQTTMGFIKDSIFILIGRLFFRKTILHLRGSDFKNWVASSPKIIQLYVGFILGIVQGVIVLGNNLRYIFEDYCPVDKIFVVPNGGDYDFGQALTANQDPYLLYLGNLLESKGIEDILKAIKILNKKQELDFQLHAVGAWYSEETKRSCLKLVTENKLPVTFSPAISGKEKLSMLKNASALVFTPREPEGHPWVVVEAMAAGLPIIATAQGAIPESVINRKNGYIVGIRRPSEIADKIDRLMKDTEQRKKMGKQSRAMYLNNFSEDKMVERLCHVFEKVITA